MRGAWWLAALIACGGDDDTTAGAGQTAPLPYIAPEGDPPAAPAEVAAVAAAAQEAVDRLTEVSAWPVQSAYEEAMAGQSDYCPYYYSTTGGSYWYDSCTSEDGTDFDGYAFALAVEDVPDGYGNTYSYWQLYGSASVVTPSAQFEAGGAAYWLYYTDDATYDYYESLVQGVFAWDGTSAAGTWLANPDYDPDLYVGALTARIDPRARQLTVSGGYSGFSDDGWAASFDGVVIFTTELGSACEREPAGTVSVRDPDGNWYDVLFDGPSDAYDDVPKDECDGCGQAFFQGSPMGEVCLDFAAWTTWEGDPW